MSPVAGERERENGWTFYLSRKGNGRGKRASILVDSRQRKRGEGLREEEGERAVNLQNEAVKSGQSGNSLSYENRDSKNLPKHFALATSSTRKEGNSVGWGVEITALQIQCISDISSPPPYFFQFTVACGRRGEKRKGRDEKKRRS